MITTIQSVGDRLIQETWYGYIGEQHLVVNNIPKVARARGFTWKSVDRKLRHLVWYAPVKELRNR